MLLKKSNISFCQCEQTQALELHISFTEKERITSGQDMIPRCCVLLFVPSSAALKERLSSK